MRITMDDIARKAGVTRQVVSHALKDSTACRISQAKRAEIKRIAEELGFQRNYAALQLKGLSTKTVAVMFASYVGPKYETIWAAATTMRKAGYQTFVASVEHEKEFISQVNEYVSRGVMGILSIGLPYLKPKHLSIPFIRLLRDGDESPANIDINVVKGAEIEAEHLIDVHARRRFAFVNMGNHPHALNKAKGIRKACEKAGLPFSCDDIIKIQQDPCICRKLLALLEKKSYDALMFDNDLLAGKTMAFLKQEGYRIPQDISITGFLGHTACELTDPPITTMIEPFYESGCYAARFLLDCIDRKQSDTVLCENLLPRLWVGGSCGCTPQKITRIFWEGAFQLLSEQNYFVKVPPAWMLDADGRLLP